MLRQINDNVIAFKDHEDACDFSVYYEEGYDPTLDYKINGEPWTQHLPPGKWKILGKLDELTDQDKKKVVDIINYATTATVELSFEVFCKVNKLYSVNPLGEFMAETGHSDDCHCGSCERKYKEYSESKENTGDWLILLREGE
jgi:hypothetical protein